MWQTFRFSLINSKVQFKQVTRHKLFKVYHTLANTDDLISATQKGQSSSSSSALKYSVFWHISIRPNPKHHMLTCSGFLYMFSMFLCLLEYPKENL